MLYRARLLAFSLVVVAAFPAIAQDAEAPAPGEFKTVSLDFAMDNGTASMAGLRAALDLERFLSLGILWNMRFTSEGSRPATELVVGIWTVAKLLSEENDLPVTFAVRAEFLKRRTISPYLDASGLVKSGSGYLIGASLSRKFAVSGRARLNVALDGWYAFDTYTLEKAAGSDIVFTTQITPVSDYFYGLAVEYELPVADNMAFAFGVRAHLNSVLHVYYGPAVTLITW